MADIRFHCPKCEQPLVIEESGAGTFVDCPKCGDQLVVPAPVTVLQPVEPTPPVEPAPATPRVQMSDTIKRAWKKVALVALVCGLIASLLLGIGRHNSLALQVGIFGLLAVFLAIVAPFVRRLAAGANEAQQQRQREYQERVDKLIEMHAETLRIKREQKQRPDGYGNLREDDWEKEMSYFCQKILRPAFPELCDWSLLDRYRPTAKQPENASDPNFLDVVLLSNSQLRKVRRKADLANDIAYAHHTRASLYRRINAIVDEFSERKPFTAIDPSTFTPGSFEAYCTRLLNENGWAAELTGESGDQGVDIVATRAGKKAVFQCKLYNSLVGNAAVQEVIAGKAWASADYAFVVSNADFTPQAKALAAKTGVHLIHYSKLARLDGYLT